MAAENYALVMEFTNMSEGGFVDHPKDPGGATNHGITAKTLAEWRGYPVTMDDVRRLSREEAEEIYRAWYFAPVYFDELPSGLDYTLVDFGINSGPGTAIKYLQRALGVRADGYLGPITMSAVRTAHEMGQTPELIKKINMERLAMMKRLAHWSSFKRGWTRRVVGDKPGVQDGDIGVIDRSIMLYQRSKDLGTSWSIPAPKPVKGKAQGVVSSRSKWLTVEGVAKAATTAGPVASAVQDQPILQVGLVMICLIGIAYLAWEQFRREAP